jgi:hypothetical protein
MKMKFVLSLAALVAFMALPVFAQHGGSGSHGMSSMHGSDSMHGSSSTHGDKSSTHDGQKTAGQLLTQNTKLASKLQSLLPAGTDLQTAAAGFKNLGQFVAAVHVSHNLGIPFDQLKAAMIGPPTQSLGKAIQQLQPSANTKAAVKTATKQADQDMDGSGS